MALSANLLARHDAAIAEGKTLIIKPEDIIESSPTVSVQLQSTSPTVSPRHKLRTGSGLEVPTAQDAVNIDLESEKPQETFIREASRHPSSNPEWLKGEISSILHGHSRQVEKPHPPDGVPAWHALVFRKGKDKDGRRVSIAESPVNNSPRTKTRKRTWQT
jgi:hypothetical protein